MPTDLLQASIRQRNGRAELSANISLGLVCLIVCLSVLISLFASNDVAQAVAQTGLLELGRLQASVPR